MDAKDELAKMIAETECEIEILKQDLSNKKEDLKNAIDQYKDLSDDQTTLEEEPEDPTDVPEGDPVHFVSPKNAKKTVCGKKWKKRDALTGVSNEITCKECLEGFDKAMEGVKVEEPDADHGLTEEESFEEVVESEDPELKQEKL